MNKHFKIIASLTQLIERRFERWLTARMPAQKCVTLTHKNIFIFPSKFGLNFLILCFILFLLGTNYQNNLILFLVFFLCSFMATCLLLSYQNITDLTLTANQVKPQFVGQESVFSLRVAKKRNRGQQLDFYFKQSNSSLKSLMDEQQVLIYSLSKKRGWFNPGRVTIRSTFPFGLFTVWTHLDFGLRVLLYPEPLASAPLLVSLSAEQKKGLINFAHGFEQFSMLKSFHPGESLKSVAWKQLAQGRGWFSKQFEQSQGGPVLLDLALYTHLDLEIKLRLLCFQVLELAKHEASYALKLGNKTIASAHGLAHKEACLKALALYGLNG